MTTNKLMRKGEFIRSLNIPDKSKDEILAALLGKEIYGDHNLTPEIKDAHNFCEELGIVPGSFVKVSYLTEVGIVTALNPLQDGVRFPVEIKFKRGIFQYSLFSITYDDVVGYKEKYKTAKNAIKHMADDLLIEVIDPQIASKIISTQELLFNMNQKELEDFLNNKKYQAMNLPYIKEFAKELLENYINNKCLTV